MANAFGALGGDLSAISINPAGIAVYRTSEFSFTPSLSLNQSTANYSPFSTKEDKFSFPLNQIGGVATQKTLREKTEGLVSTHFGFTYNRTADFNYKMNSRMGQGVKDIYSMEGITANTLLTNIMLEANGYSTNNMSDRAYFAYETFLINPLFEESTEYYSEYEYVVDIDENNSEIIYRNLNGVDQDFLIENSGYAGEYGFTFGANISHVFLLGASLNFQSFKFEQRQTFREINTYGFDPAYQEDLDYFDAFTNLSQKGFGINGKFGMILNLSPVRIGASFHTPTFYGIDEEYYEGIESFFRNYDHYINESNLGTFSYNYRTPYRAQGSIAFVLGKIALVSFDYEMTDHTSSKITSKDGFNTGFAQLNDQIKANFRIAHDFKAGVEIKPVPYLALRGGAAYLSSPFKEASTDVDLSKWMATAGIGIRSKNFYFDVAYAQTIYDDSYFLHTEGSIWDGVYFNDPIELSNRRHQASFTFGWKF